MVPGRAPHPESGSAGPQISGPPCGVVDCNSWASSDPRAWCVCATELMAGVPSLKSYILTCRLSKFTSKSRLLALVKGDTE